MRNFQVRVQLFNSNDTKLVVSTAVELATVSRSGGKLDYKILDNATVDSVLKELDLAQPPPENA